MDQLVFLGILRISIMEAPITNSATERVIGIWCVEYGYAFVHSNM